MTTSAASGRFDGVETSTCPSCGYVSASIQGTIKPPFPASPECYAAYQELSAYDMERARPDFLHQEVVDAYAAQHPGPPAKPISTWFALVGLHLALDLGLTGKGVQRAHMKLGRHKRKWPALARPDDLSCMTAADVMRELPGDTRDRGLIRWANQVWQCWTPVHAAIATLCADQGL
jgi:hypothetical protein